MDPDLILKADVLDIIFENRNKEYGAYELHKHYHTRLKKSILSIFILMTVLFGINYWMNRQFSRNHGHFLPIDGDIRLKDIELKPPALKPASIERRNSPQVQSTIPRIIKEITPVNPTPTIEEQQQKQISTINITGDSIKDLVHAQALDNAEKNSGNSSSDYGNEKETIYRIAEKMPEFPGGMKALQEFLAKNLRMPREDMDAGTSVRVQMQFVIDKEGAVDGIELVQSGGQVFDAEVIRVMKKMPRWKPGMQNGNKVAVYYNLPVVFRAEEN